MNIFLLLIILLLQHEPLRAEVLCKTKLQRYYTLKVYDITLCKESGAEYENIFQTQFVVVLKYRTSSSSSWIGRRSLNEISKNYQLKQAERQFYQKHFDGFFPSVKNGDEIKMEFIPEYGAKFYYNGKFFGDIKDITFAIRTANIWLHPNSTFQETRNFLFSDE